MMTRYTLALLVAVSLLTACTPPSRREPTQTPTSAATCPVTLPVPSATIPPAAAQPIIGGQQGGAPAPLSMYGNDALWVVIPKDGTIVARPDADGWLGDKLGTVRLIPGTLTAAVRRLDGPAAPGRVSIPDGYGPSGFQAFGFAVPSAGCWEITERIAAKELRVVVAIHSAP